MRKNFDVSYRVLFDKSLLGADLSKTRVKVKGGVKRKTRKKIRIVDLVPSLVIKKDQVQQGGSTGISLHRRSTQKTAHIEGLKITVLSKNGRRECKSQMQTKKKKKKTKKEKKKKKKDLGRRSVLESSHVKMGGKSGRGLKKGRASFLKEKLRLVKTGSGAQF